MSAENCVMSASHVGKRAANPQAQVAKRRRSEGPDSAFDDLVRKDGRPISGPCSTVARPLSASAPRCSWCGR